MNKWKFNFQLNGISIAILLSVFLSGCLDVSNINQIDIINSDAEYAIPLINSKLTIETVLSDQIENAGISYDEDGLTVVSYSADVIKKRSYDVFKPIVFPGPLPFTDSVTTIRFDLIDNYNVEKGTIRGDSIRFGFTSPFDEEISLEIHIQEFSKNGQPFIKNIIIPANGSIVTPLYSIRGWDFVSPQNELSFIYDARKQNGTRVLLEDSYFEFTYFVFDFVQGFLGKNTQKLYDHQIEVDIFDLWESGMLEFENPRIQVDLDNSFGFPVKAIINHFDVTDLNGNVVPLESTLFNEELFFDYPSLNEIGEVKSSSFVFDKDNSNFATAFNQRIVEVSYDVDAQANPANDPNEIGFFLFDSYYLLNVAVELPMRFKADAFQLADHYPIDSIPVEFDLVSEFELKTYIENLFPVDSYVQVYFEDENGVFIDSLFTDGEKHFPGAIQNGDGSTTAVEASTPFYLSYSAERKNILKQIRKIYPRVRLSTQNNDGEWTSIYKDQGLGIKMGLKFKLN
jgi:hypothetical protein